jgi:hypothetical protein
MKRGVRPQRKPSFKGGLLFGLPLKDMADEENSRRRLSRRDGRINIEFFVAW